MKSFIRQEIALPVGLLTLLFFKTLGSDLLTEATPLAVYLPVSLALLAIVTWAIFSVVRHSDALAIKLGEPFGTLILTLSVISLEVVMISSVMLTGEPNPTMARDTMFAVVMLVTNVRGEDIDDLLASVRLLQRRHLVCVASLREKSLDAALAEEVRDLQGALHAGAVARYLEQRTAAHEALRSHRVMVLDVTADELPAALVERYLAVKRDGVL